MYNMNITIIAGARPNFMKIAPLTRAIHSVQEAGHDIRFRLVYTGSEADKSLEPSLFHDLDMPRPDVFLEIESSDFFERMGGILIAFARDLEQHPTDLVIVVDDMTPTMACSLVAKKKGLKVAHLVAGIRSFDMDMPKELNRMITDGLSDYLFTAGMVANRNLNQTGTEQANVHFVGNLLMDALRYNYHRFVRPQEMDTWQLDDHKYVLLTLNRRALLEDGEKLKSLFDTIFAKIGNLPIILPVHEYVEKRLETLGISSPNLHILAPQSYLLFGYWVSHAAVIITDSGNIAEEATFLGIPCITLNRYAEHPETVTMGTNCLVGDSPEELAEALEVWRKGEWKSGSLPERWDGRAAERIVQTLLDL